MLLSDVVGFGARTRTDEDRRVIREALFRITHVVFRNSPTNGHGTTAVTAC